MSILNRTIIEIPKGELTGIESRFGSQAQLDMDNIPKRYQELVESSRVKCMEQADPIGVYGSQTIKSLEEEHVYLSDGLVLDGKMMSILLDQADEVVLFAVTLRGFDVLENTTDNIMEKFFIDCWGTALIESADAWLTRYLKELVKQADRFPTNTWSPGQHNFEISNQKALFGLLKPEEIGLTLSEYLMMHPQKSISCVMGVRMTEDNRNMIPCDYCDRRDTCRSAYQGSCAG